MSVNYLTVRRAFRPLWFSGYTGGCEFRVLLLGATFRPIAPTAPTSCAIARPTGPRLNPLHARPHPPPLARTPRLLARLLW
jgi:hypothetical protein